MAGRTVRQLHRRQNGRVAVLAAVVAVLGAAALHWQASNFVGSTHSTRSSSSPGSLRAPPVPHRSASALAAFSWDSETPPPLPRSPQEQAQQASDAVMRAYRQGVTRQTIRFNLAMVFDLEQIYLKGKVALLNNSLPLVETFAVKLWGGESFEDLKTNLVDDETTTLLYRQAPNAMQDAAVLFLPNREYVTSVEAQELNGKMGDRLLVMANTESAPAPWSVEYGGKDFMDQMESAKSVVRTFREQSYVFAEGPFNGWKMTTFRAYPFDWEIYIESLDFKLIKLGDFKEKPSPEKLEALTEAYEKENKILPLEKVGKMVKDFRKAEERRKRASPAGGREPPPSSSRSMLVSKSNKRRTCVTMSRGK